MSEDKECYEKSDIDNLRSILDNELDNTINKLIKIKKNLSKVDINFNVIVLTGFIHYFYDIQAIIRDINSEIKYFKEVNKLEKELDELGKENTINKNGDEKDE